MSMYAEDYEYERPDWITSVATRILDDFEDGRISLDPIAPTIDFLGMLEIDPCPIPAISYVKNDIMLTWTSPRGTLSIGVIGNGQFLVWLSRNGYVAKKWEKGTIADVRRILIDLFVIIGSRINQP